MLKLGSMFLALASRQKGYLVLLSFTLFSLLVVCAGTEALESCYMLACKNGSVLDNVMLCLANPERVGME